MLEFNSKSAQNFLFNVGNFYESPISIREEKKISCETGIFPVSDEFISVQIMLKFPNDGKRGLLFNEIDRWEPNNLDSKVIYSCRSGKRKSP